MSTKTEIEANARAAKVAILSRRMPGAPAQESSELVRVSAMHRDGYTGFLRGGIKWPSTEEGRLAYVTPRLLAAIKAEPMLRVDVRPDVDGIDLATVERLDVPLREIGDENSIALDDAAATQKKIQQAYAKRKADDLQVVLAAVEAGDPVPRWLIEGTAAPAGVDYDKVIAELRERAAARKAAR